MTAAFSTAALFPMSTIPALELISRAGFEEAELMPQCREDISPDSLNKIRALDIRVSSIHFPLVYFPVFYNPHIDMVQEAQELSRALVKAGRSLNTKIIVIHALSKMTPLQMKMFQLPVTQNIRYLCDKALEATITIALENNPQTLASTPENLIKQVEAIERSNIAPMVDTTEAMEAGIDPVFFIENVKPVHMHLSDHNENAKHIPAGRGLSDWPAILTALKEINYSGRLVMEPSYHYFLDNPDAGVRESLEFINNFI